MALDRVLGHVGHEDDHDLTIYFTQFLSSLYHQHTSPFPGTCTKNGAADFCCFWQYLSYKNDFIILMELL